MFESNGRIKINEDGIVFNEKDIIYSKYPYKGDIKIDIDFDYNRSGFGILFLNPQANDTLGINTGYFLKIENKMLRLLYKKYNNVDVEFITSTYLEPDSNIKLRLIKENNEMTIISLTNNETIARINLNEGIEEYKIGIYSNADNVINSLQVFSRAPGRWFLNMKKTVGGHVGFIKDGFYFANSYGLGEFEQDNISLDKGKYFLRYEASENSDIEPFIFLSNDTRVKDEDKNILLENNCFILQEADEVSLKFKGKVGTIKNICIKENENDSYISTKMINSVFTGSKIIIKKLANIKSITFGININNIFTEEDVLVSKILQSLNEDLKFEDCNIILGKDYTFELTNTNGVVELCIYDKTKTLFFKRVLMISQEEEITMFYNIDAIIDEFKIVYIDDRNFDVIMQNTEQIVVPADITSPIVIINSNGVPLDISSSFRVYQKDGYDYYKFTNWEREIFDSATRLFMKNKFKVGSDNLKVYGIFDATKVNDKDIYRIDENFDSIDYYCERDNYVLLPVDQYTIDDYNNSIILNENEKFDQFVIDYLKDDSYAINKNLDNGYLVDIVCSTENFIALYDLSSNYITFKINSDGYLAVRGDFLDENI